MTSAINNREDLLDVRDIIDLVENLESDVIFFGTSESGATPQELEETKEELKTLTEILNDMKGYSGDHQWRGNWYPVTLIRDSYFEDYAEQFAEDIGAIDPKSTWPNNCIDWKRAASELQMDYTSVEFKGVTYWYR